MYTVDKNGKRLPSSSNQNIVMSDEKKIVIPHDSPKNILLWILLSVSLLITIICIVLLVKNMQK